MIVVFCSRTYLVVPELVQELDVWTDKRGLFVEETFNHISYFRLQERPRLFIELLDAVCYQLNSITTIDEITHLSGYFGNDNVLLLVRSITGHANKTCQLSVLGSQLSALVSQFSAFNSRQLKHVISRTLVNAKDDRSFRQDNSRTFFTVLRQFESRM